MPRTNVGVRRASFRQSQKRQTIWAFLTPTLTVFTTAGGTILNSGTTGLLNLRPFTIVRSHVELYIGSDQTANTESQIGAFGMAIVSDQAVAIGVTAVPTPDTDAGSDLWFAHQYMHNRIAVSSAASVFQTGTKYTVDSRAMRKVEDGQDLIVVGELSAAGQGFVLHSAGRFLVKTN